MLAVAQVEGGTSNQAKYASLGPQTDKLHVFPWQIYPDMVVFDWLIRLGDKDRYHVTAQWESALGVGGHKNESFSNIFKKLNGFCKKSLNLPHLLDTHQLTSLLPLILGRLTSGLGSPN